MRYLPDIPYVGLEIYVDDDLSLGMWSNLGKVKGGKATIGSVQIDGNNNYWISIVELGSYTQFLYTDGLNLDEYQKEMREKFGLQVAHLKS